MSTSCTVFVVQAVFLNVLDDGLWDQVSDAHVAFTEEADLGAGNVVLDELLDDVDVLLPLLESGKGLVNVGSGSLGEMLVRISIRHNDRLDIPR